MSNLIKIHPVGAELFHVDGRIYGQIDIHDEASCRFMQCCEKRLKFKGFLVSFNQAAVVTVISQKLRRYGKTETHTYIQPAFPST